MIRTFITILILSTASLLLANDAPVTETDIVVYGATSAGVTAAVQASRSGKDVVLIDCDNHIGGASTGGLGWTDYGKVNVVGGLAAEFYDQVTNHYRLDAAWIKNDPKRTALLKPGARFIKSFEPHVAADTFNEMLKKSKVKVLSNERLDRSKPLNLDNNKITTLTLESGRQVVGKAFIDTSYEGDLMAMSGVSYHVGRESRDTYGEILAGVLPETTSSARIKIGNKEKKLTQPKRNFDHVDSRIPGPVKGGWNHVNPYDENGKLLYGIQDVALAPPGTGDKKVQAYNVRICLTKNPDNLIPITEPKGYDPSKYELLARYIKAHNLTQIKQVLYKIDAVPNLKTDINDGCPYSTDYIGANWDYPEASYEQRKAILQDHNDFTRGLLYFIGHDKRVPESIRTEMLKYGYPKDEYTETNNWTPQVYIRETRRMIGKYVMTQKDIAEETTKSHSIGLGSYALDSHHVQRVITPQGSVINEGNFTVYLEGPYEIPYESIVPKKSECTNLLVPVCLSSSHVAYGSIRMEPVFMLLGHAAAAAASLALDENIAVQDVNYNYLEKVLLKQDMILHKP